MYNIPINKTDSITMEGKSKFVEVLGNSPLIKVLDFFLDNDVYDYSKSDVFRETGISRITLQGIFAGLEKKGIIKKTRVSGKSQMYQLNKETSIVQNLIKFDLELTVGKQTKKRVAIEA